MSLAVRHPSSAGAGVHDSQLDLRVRALDLRHEIVEGHHSLPVVGSPLGLLVEDVDLQMIIRLLVLLLLRVVPHRVRLVACLFLPHSILAREVSRWHLIAMLRSVVGTGFALVFILLILLVLELLLFGLVGRVLQL